MFEEKINEPEVRDYFESLRLATRLNWAIEDVESMSERFFND